jgi:hypothetical protein
VKRKPIVAGQFYPADPLQLKKYLEEVMPSGKKRTYEAVGAMVPHAGYVFSGYVAAEVYSSMRPSDVYIVLGPNHTGRGMRFAVGPENYGTPLGEAAIDRELADSIMDRTELLDYDSAAHAFEHSVEVQVPFIQKSSPEAAIVPVVCQSGSMEEYREIAGALAGAISSSGKKVTIVASSDMSHYESRERARSLDNIALERIERFDATGLVEVVKGRGISMCGYVPVAIMMIASGEMGATEAKILKYADSGDMTGDTAEVVGYAGAVVY